LIFLLQKFSRKFSLQVPNGNNESVGASNKPVPENHKESSSPRAKPKVMLKPSSSFISRKIKESRFSKELKESRFSKDLKKETAAAAAAAAANQEQSPPALPKSAPPKTKPSKSSLFLPLLSKYTTSAPPPEPPKPELPARPPKEYFTKRSSLTEFKPLKEKNFLKAASSDNLMGAKPNKSALFGSSSSGTS
jgi:hypothetical protein